VNAPLSAPIHLTVVGCGRVFERFHLPAITRLPDFTLADIVEANPLRLQSAASDIGGVARHQRLEDKIRSVAPVAVLILTPPDSHADLAAQALAAGAHVLVEKPMALTVADARAMTDVARDAERRLQVGFNRRHREPYLELHARLATLGTGHVRRARFELSFPPGAWGAHSDFLGHDARGGGVLDDVLSHQADLMGWLLAAEAATARARNTATGLEWGVQTSTGAIVEGFAAHGPYAEYVEVELADGCTLSAGGHWWKQTRRRPWNGRAFGKLRDTVALAKAKAMRRPSATLESFADQLRDFARGIRTGRAIGADGAAGFRAVAIVTACRASALSDSGWRKVEQA
jgi:predicted dehydrogenase